MTGASLRLEVTGVQGRMIGLVGRLPEWLPQGTPNCPLMNAGRQGVSGFRTLCL